MPGPGTRCVNTPAPVADAFVARRRRNCLSEMCEAGGISLCTSRRELLVTRSGRAAESVAVWPDCPRLRASLHKKLSGIVRFRERRQDRSLKPDDESQESSFHPVSHAPAIASRTLASIRSRTMLPPSPDRSAQTSSASDVRFPPLAGADIAPARTTGLQGWDANNEMRDHS
jgi:hypothetical protein